MLNRSYIYKDSKPALPCHSEEKKNVSSNADILSILKILPYELQTRRDPHPTKSKLFYKRNYLLPYLQECACKKSQFDRIKFKRREIIERKIINTITQRYPIEHNKLVTLNYLSLGSGGLLQDYVLCFQLLVMNYSLNIHLIEPDINTEIFIDSLRQFKKLAFFAAEKNLSFSVNCSTNVLEYIESYPNQAIHVANAIDFESPIEYLNDLLLTHQQLSVSGIFYLALDKHDYFYDKTSLMSSDFSGSGQTRKPEDYSYLPKLANINQKIQEKEKILKEAIKEAIPTFNEYMIKNILLFSGVFETARENYAAPQIDSSHLFSHGALPGM